MIAIILQALWSLARTAIKSKLLAVIGTLAVVLSGLGVAPLIVLAIAGIASGGAAWFKRQGKVSLGVIPAFGRLGLVLGTATVAVLVSLIRLFLSFLKIGAIVFGSGYVVELHLKAGRTPFNVNSVYLKTGKRFRVVLKYRTDLYLIAGQVCT